MRLCSYIVRKDTGLAPNPFWGSCTLAVCTPNHMGIRLKEEDWVVGFLNKERGNRLLFAMKVKEILHFDAYYKDSQFKAKRPNVNGSWRERCGDNMYFLDAKGQWKRHPTIYHRTSEHLAQDTKKPYVFVGKYFYYFGQNAPKLPKEYHEIVVNRQGVKCNHEFELTQKFIGWLKQSFKPGIHGDPIDNPDLKKKLRIQCR